MAIEHIHIETPHCAIEEQPRLMFCPGGPGLSHKYLKATTSKLQAQFKTVFFDPVGTGASAYGCTGDWCVEQNVNSIANVLGSLGLSEVVLIGHSAGAVDALKFASEHPEHVSHLILLNPVIGTLQASIRSNSVFGDDIDAAKVAHQFWVERDFSISETYVEKVMPHYEPVEPSADYLSTFGINIEKFLSCINEYLDFDYSGYLAKLETPTLICLGQDDPLTIASEVKEHLHALGNNRLQVRVFKNSGHTITLTEENELMLTIRSFIESCV